MNKFWRGNLNTCKHSKSLYELIILQYDKGTLMRDKTLHNEINKVWISREKNPVFYNKFTEI